MSELAQRLLKWVYSDVDHPYRILEKRVEAVPLPHAVLLDAGCGRTVPMLRKYLGKARRLIGVELVAFTDVPVGIETHNADLGNLPLESETIDVIFSRSVFAHLTDPQSVYVEFERVLRPGGVIIFITANLWDYGTLLARLIPNRFHAAIVKHVESRDEEDTFPTAYVDEHAPGRGSAGARIETIGRLIRIPKPISQLPAFQRGALLLRNVFRAHHRHVLQSAFPAWMDPRDVAQAAMNRLHAAQRAVVPRPQSAA